METNTSMLPVLTEDVAKIQLNIGLTKSGITIQKLADAEASLIYNEDNMPQIIQYISTAKKAKKSVKETYDNMVDKQKQEIANALSVKKAFDAQIDEPLIRAEQKLQEIHSDREQRRKVQDQKLKRDAEIRQGISKNLEHYSQQIAACDTFDKLRVVENRVNLEKANKNKYNDLYDEAKEAYETLTDAIKKQKIVIKEKTSLEEELKAAMDGNDDLIAMEIQYKMQKLDETIEENKISVQEKAIAVVMNQEVSVAEEILPVLDYKIRTWNWEVINIKETEKRRPDWVELTTVDKLISDYLKEHKEEWNKKDETEVIVDGIKFIRTKKLA